MSGRITSLEKSPEGLLVIFSTASGALVVVPVSDIYIYIVVSRR